MTVCPGLVVVALVVAGGLVYWAEPNQKLLSGLLIGAGVLLLLCVGVFYMYLFASGGM